MNSRLKRFEWKYSNNVIITFAFIYLSINLIFLCNPNSREYLLNNIIAPINTSLFSIISRGKNKNANLNDKVTYCLLYTSDAADE